MRGHLILTGDRVAAFSVSQRRMEMNENDWNGAFITITVLIFIVGWIANDVVQSYRNRRTFKRMDRQIEIRYWYGIPEEEIGGNGITPPQD